jgi:membrane associated rhomboid family serine protease
MKLMNLLCLGSLAKMGALDWNKVVHQNEGWRLISCIWLHAGLIHLLVNMLSLLFIGIRLEQQFGFGELLTMLNQHHLDNVLFLRLNVNRLNGCDLATF